MSIVKNSPDMNIVNQINAALNDVRATMVELATWARTPDISDQIVGQDKVRYQIHLALTMVSEHRDGKSISWSDRKPQVEEEFS